MSRHFVKVLTCLGLGVLMLSTPAITQASPIYSNFDTGFGYEVSTGLVVGNGFDGSYYAQGDTFTPGANATLGTIELALGELYQGSQVDPITVNLTSDAGNQPGAILESFLIAPGSLGLFGNNNAPIVLTSGLNPLLLAGTQYWITASLPLTSAVAWNFNSTGDISPEALSQDGGAWFSPSGLTPGAFQVDGRTTAVPEPATTALGLVAGAFAMIRRRMSGSKERA